MAITPLPPAPLLSDSTSTFNSKAFVFVDSLSTFVTETNDLAIQVSDDAQTAEAAAAAAVATTSATQWVSGTTYSLGAVVWSPANYLLYRRKVAGAGTTDPSLDPTNWALIFGSGNVTLNGVETLTNKTVQRLILNDGFTEEVFAITDGTTVNLDPNNGSIQTWTLGANRTPGQANWASGQAITLLIDDGTARTITWTTLAVAWKTDAGLAPTLNTSTLTVIVLWKVGTTIYGARVGDA